MIRVLNRLAVRLSVTLLLIAVLIPVASARPLQPSSGDKSKYGESLARSDEAAEPAPAAEPAGVPAPPELKQVTVSYVLYSNAIAPPVPGAVPASAAAATRRLPPAPAPAVSTAPMTVGEKFNYFLRGSFYPPGPYLNPVLTGMWSELWDNNEGKEDTIEDFFADSMTRAARRFGNRAANNFYERFLFASIFRQDPRYHRSGKKGAGAKVGYALSRLFVTQGDRGGDQFNISFLAGGLAGAYTSREWQRDDKQSNKDTLLRWVNHIAVRGLTNILREFIGGQ